ncbi:DMSO reductase anchor subunit [Bradyrhizobium sp. LM6.10]|jgi:DMSO reductase anchor subunit
MDKALAYAISIFIVVVGVGILVAGITSSSPAFWTCVAVVPISIGLVSAFGDC